MPRETAVTIRMSFKEKETLKAIAKTEGLSLSEFLRDVAFGVQAEAPSKPSSADVVAPVVKQAVSSEQELRAKAMVLVRTKGLSYRVPRAEVERS